jgi:nitrogen regulatory protein P-II 1
MKEIKAYLRCSKVDDVINGLHTIGVENMTVIDVMALGKGLVDPERYKYSIECVERYSQVAKLEIIAADRDAPAIVEVIRARAHTGDRGDGIIYISDVTEAIKIRTGVSGPGILQPRTEQSGNGHTHGG